MLAMPRPKRLAIGGYVYHVLNRANGRLRIFRKPADFLAFEKILAAGIALHSMRLCGYCLMSNHWHLLLWPQGDDDLPRFMRWITLTHVQRYHAAHATVGIGHLYQGRYKSFPVQDDSHYLTVLRYIESNPLRAELVERPEQWAWSSFAVRRGRQSPVPLSDGPTELPARWAALVQAKLPSDVQTRLDMSLHRGTPFGSDLWTETAVGRLGLECTIRPRGRPRKCT